MVERLAESLEVFRKTAWIERAQCRSVEHLAGAEQERQVALVACDARCLRVRDVDPRGADTALRKAIRVQVEPRWVRRGQGDRWCALCGFTGSNPSVQLRDGCLQDVVVLWGEIDAVRQSRAHQLIRRRVRSDDVVD